MSLLKYSPELVRRDLRYPTVRGQLGINPPVPGAEEVQVAATRQISSQNRMKMRALAEVRRRQAAAARGLGGFWDDIIDQGFDLTKTVLKGRAGSFESRQIIDPNTGKVVAIETSGRQPTNFALPVGVSTTSASLDTGGLGGGLVIVGGAALLLVLLMSRGGGGRGRR